MAWPAILLRVGAVAALLGLLWWATVLPRQQLVALRATHAQALAQHKATLDDLAAVARVAADRARAASKAVKLERAAVNAKHEEDLFNANREADRLRDCLRTGACELQDHWTGRVPGAGQGAAAADTGEADAAGRIDGATRIVQAADTDAAVIDWLWESWQADRAAVIAAGCAVVEGD